MSRRPLVLVLSGIITVVLFSFVLIGESRAETTVPVPPNQRGPFDCWNLAMRLGKRAMKALRFCSKELKDNSSSTKEMSERLGCVVKCTMTRMNVTKDNVYSKEAVKAAFRQYIPSDLAVDAIMERYTKMCEQDQAIVLDPDEYSCKSYSKFMVCFQSAFGDFAENSEFCIPKEKHEAPKPEIIL